MNEYYGYGYDTAKIIEIESDTLDNILANLVNISLLKIDVQGYEKYVISGAKEVLKRTKYLLIEVIFHSHYEGDILYPELHNLVLKNGFRLLNLSSILQIKHKALWADALYIRN